jgi:lipopolysaccharide biosynthesis regulator YciM
MLAELLSRTGSYSESKKLFSSILLRHGLTDPEKSLMLVLCAKNAIRMGELDNAMELCKMAQKIHHKATTDILILEILERQLRWEECLKLIDSIKVRKSLPFDLKRRKACILMKLGESLDKNMNHSEARKLYKEASELNPESFYPLLLEGASYNEEGLQQEASDKWTELAVKFPESSSIVFDSLEYLYYDMGDFGKIITFYKSLDQNPLSKNRANRALARIYFKMGNWESALRTLDNLDNDDLSSLLIKLRIGIKSNLSHADLAHILDSMEKITGTNNSVYICSICGFSKDYPLYHCDNCGSWESFPIL